MNEKMEKTTCFRIMAHTDEELDAISKESGLPKSELIRHCIITEVPKLKEIYGIKDSN
jgi:predicted DNA-binding protein